jgi:hypothetical protein
MYVLLTPRLEIGPKVGNFEEVNEKILYYENNAIVTQTN